MIDRELVHRTVEREVFVIEGAVLDEQSMSVEVCIPGVHARVRRAGSQLPTIVMLEVFRQGAFLTAHQLGRIPIDWRFVAHGVNASWSSTPPVIPALGAIWCELHVSLDARPLEDEEFALAWGFEFTEEGQLVARGNARATARSPRTHEARLTAQPNRAEEATSTLDLDGVHGSTPIEWDIHDPFLSDLPHEEVSSLVLADAVLSHPAISSHPAAFEMEINSPAAQGRPFILRQRGSSDAPEFVIFQDSLPIATSRVHVDTTH